VWDHFRFRKTNGKIDLNTAICGICRKEYANKGIFLEVITEPISDE